MNAAYENKRITVTGATRGIGVGIAELERGAEAIGTHCSAPTEAELCARYLQRTVHRVEPTRTEEIAVSTRTVSVAGAADGIVSQAVTLSPQLWEDFGPETLRWVFAVNVDVDPIMRSGLVDVTVPSSTADGGVTR
ncbi:hypothetical protein ACF09Y_24625 [Streptomyces massasporeus]|uniref:hypothetical protein n=1 Tax=Streptomyces massasporeus TaxID=67324 RepID=UPI0036FB40EF